MKNFIKLSLSLTALVLISQTALAFDAPEQIVGTYTDQVNGRVHNLSFDFLRMANRGPEAIYSMNIPSYIRNGGCKARVTRKGPLLVARITGCNGSSTFQCHLYAKRKDRGQFVGTSICVNGRSGAPFTANLRFLRDRNPY